MSRRAPKVAEDVAGVILNRISAGDYPLSSSLPSEAQMLAEFGVGRASLRESLRILELHGVLRIKAGPGGGPVVRDVQTADFADMAKIFLQVSHMTYREVIEARLMLEPFLAGMAAGNQATRLAGTATPGDLQDDREYLASASDFHRRIGAMSSNRVLDLFAHALSQIFHERVEGMLYPPEMRADVLCEHDEIALAIEAGDATRAEALMRKHMEAYRDYVSRRYPALMDEPIRWRR